MNKSGNHSFPRWAFAIIAVCGLLASGIHIGIMSVAGFSGIRLIEAVGFGLLGILTFRGALSKS